MKETAKKFWQDSVEYPEYGNIKERRLYELNYLVPRLKGNSLLDLGCGDGALLNCLVHLTQFCCFYGYDLSENLLKRVNSSVKVKTYDCYNPEPLPDTDVTIMAGVLPFLFENETANTILGLIRSPVLFLRSPCALGGNSITVNKFSSDLQRDYASLYRTLPEVMELVGNHFRIEAVDRIYPDDIESKYGTKQYYIKGVK